MPVPEHAEAFEPQPVAEDRRRRTLWGTVAAVVVVGFVFLVVVSTRQAAVPVGAAGDMGGMQMQGMGGGSGMQMSMRDVDGRLVRVPDGRPGVAVFVTPRNCADCVAAVRAAARAVARSRPTAQLTVVSLDSATSRSDVAEFARSVGNPRARYVIDDRNGSLASMFKVTGLGAAAVYDAKGKIVDHPGSPGQIEQAIARAASGPASDGRR